MESTLANLSPLPKVISDAIAFQRSSSTAPYCDLNDAYSDLTVRNFACTASAEVRATVFSTGAGLGAGCAATFFLCSRLWTGAGGGGTSSMMSGLTTGCGGAGWVSDGGGAEVAIGPSGLAAIMSATAPPASIAITPPPTSHMRRG